MAETNDRGSNGILSPQRMREDMAEWLRQDPDARCLINSIGSTVKGYMTARIGLSGAEMLQVFPPENG